MKVQLELREGAGKCATKSLKLQALYMTMFEQYVELE